MRKYILIMSKSSFENYNNLASLQDIYRVISIGNTEIRKGRQIDSINFPCINNNKIDYPSYNISIYQCASMVAYHYHSVISHLSFNKKTCR